jgi:hypothetical protein
MILTSINTLSSDSSLSEASSSSVLNILSQILTILFHHIQMSITSCIFCISFTHFFVKYLAYHESRSFETRQLTEAAVPKIRDLLAKGLSKKFSSFEPIGTKLGRISPWVSAVLIFTLVRFLILITFFELLPQNLQFYHMFYF